jgi:hypothetical protein
MPGAGYLRRRRILLAGGRRHPFVADEAQVTSTSLGLSAATVTYGKERVERPTVPGGSGHIIQR